MTTVILNERHPLESEQTPKQKITPSNQGILKGRSIAIVILGTTSALSAIAAIVATIFAFYIIAILAAVTCLSLAITAIVLGLKKQKNPLTETQKIEKPAQELSSKNNELFKALKKENNIFQQNLVKQKAENENQKKEIEKLRNLVKNPPKTAKELPDDIETDQEIFIIQKENPDKPTKKLQITQQEIEKQAKLQENGHIEVEKLNGKLAENETKINNLNKDLQEKNDNIILIAQLYHKLICDVHEILDDKSKKNDKNKLDNLVKSIRDLLPNKIEREEDLVKGIKILGQIERLESQKVERPAELELEEKNEVSLKLKEICDTEKSYLQNIKALKPFIDAIKADTKLDDAQKNATVGWDSLFNESSILLNKMEKSTPANKLKDYQSNFSPQNIKNYLKAYVLVVPKSHSLIQILKQFCETEKGQKLKANFTKSYGIKLVLEDIPLMAFQRILRHNLLMKELSQKLNTLPKFSKLAIDHNLNYLKAYSEWLNLLLPPNEMIAKLKKRP